MVRNIVILGGNSHPKLVDSVCNHLGVPSCNRVLTKFEVGESRCEIKDSVRGKDVYIIQTGSGQVNDHFIDLCVMISACKTGSAKRVTAVLPLFPYSRQPDLPYNKAGAPLSKSLAEAPKKEYTFESVPATPGPGMPKSAGLANGVDMTRVLSKGSTAGANGPRGGRMAIATSAAAAAAPPTARALGVTPGPSRRRPGPTPRTTTRTSPSFRPSRPSPGTSSGWPRPARWWPTS